MGSVRMRVVLGRRHLLPGPTPFVVTPASGHGRAHPTLSENLLRESVEKTSVFIVSDLVFPEHILDQLRGLAKEVHFSVTVAPTEEFERVRRVRKLGRLVHLPRDMSIESPDLDDD